MKHGTINRSSSRTAQISRFGRGTYVKPPRMRHSVFVVSQALRGLAAFAAFQLSAPAALAGATIEGTVTTGQLNSITQPNATTTNLNQGSKVLGMDLTVLDVPKNNTLNINQPGKDSLFVGRGVGNNPFRIYGTVNADGQVFLVNPQGVIFAPGSSVNVGGLVATTNDVRMEDAVNGKFVFQNNGGTGTVVNQGRIYAPSGYAALIGPKVSNEGTIIARTVALAAGNRVALDMIGDGLISVRVEQAAVGAAALNSGTIVAEGGSVYLAARSADALLDTVVNNTGIIRANSLIERNGSIILDGGSHGVVANSGTLDVSGKEPGATGGTVKVLGEYVGLFNGSRIDASGDAGGGTVLVGGNFHGFGPEQNAKETYVASDTVINADAINSGNGGQVAIWSNNGTEFYGAVSARGGAQSGDGGFVEISGKDSLVFAGDVDTRAPKGRGGNLLLDPLDLFIIDGAGDGAQDATLANATTPANTIAFGDADVGANTVTVGQLQAQGDTNITLQATNSVRVGTADGTTAAHVDLSASLTSAANTLTLSAGNGTPSSSGNVTFNTGSTITTGGGAVAINAGQTTDTGGNAILGAITTNGGAITVNALNNVSLAAAQNASTGNVVITAQNGNITGAGLVTGNQVALDSATGVGTGPSDRVNTTAQTLAARARVSGGVFLAQTGSVSLATNNGVTNSAVGGGAYNLLSNGPITVNNGGISTANGAISLVGASLTNNDTITNNGGTSNILLRADTFNLHGNLASTVQAGGGGVIITPNTPNRSLGIEAADQQTNITNADLDTIQTTNFVVLGSANQGFSGNTVIGRDALVDGKGKSLAFFRTNAANTTTIGLHGVTTTGDVFISGGPGNIVSQGGIVEGHQVALTATTGIGANTLTGRVLTKADILAINNIANGAFVTEADGVLIATISRSVAGTPNNITNSGGNSAYNVIANGAISVNSNITTNNGAVNGVINLTGDSITNHAAISNGGLASTANIILSADAFSLGNLGATINSNGGATFLRPRTSGNSFGIEDASAQTHVNNADIASISTTNFVGFGAGSGAPGAFTGNMSIGVDNPVNGGTKNLAFLRDPTTVATTSIGLNGVTTSGNVIVSAGAGNIDNTAGGTISGNQIELRAGTGIGTSTHRVLTSANTLAVQNASGGAFVTEADTVSLADINQTVGGTASNATNTGGTGAYDLVGGGPISVQTGGVNTTGTGTTHLESTGSQISLDAGGVGNAAAATTLVAGAITGTGGVVRGTEVTLSGSGLIGTPADPLRVDAGTLNFNSAGAVSISEANDTVLTGTNTANSLTLASAGSITDAANTSVTVTNGASFSGTSITLADNALDVLSVGGNAAFTATGGGVAIGSAGAANFGTLTFNAPGAVSIAEGSSMDIVGVNTAGSATLSAAGALSDAGATSVAVTGLTDVSGTSISLGGGTFNTGTLTFNSAGAVTIAEDSSMNIVGVNTAGSATLSAAGALSDAGATSVAVTGLTDVSGTSISLGGGTFNTGTLTFNSAGTVSIHESSDTVLSGTNTADSLSLTSDGSITDLAGIKLGVTNNASFSGTSITLGTSLGDTVDFGTLTFNSPGAVSIREASATVLSGASTADSLSLVATPLGSITNTAGASLNVTQSASLSADAITLGNHAGDTINFGSLTFNSAGAVSIHESSDTVLSGTNTADSLTLSSTGSITDGLNSSVTVTTGASFSGTSISLANDAGDVLSVGGNASFTASEAGGITIGADGTVSFGSLSTTTLALGAVTSVTAGSSLSSVSASTNEGNVTIAFGGAADNVTFDGTSKSLSFTAAASGVSFSNTGAIELNGINTVQSLAVTAGGSITDATNTSVTVTNGASFSGTSITLADNTGDVISVGGNAAFTATTGGVTIGSAGAANFGTLTFSAPGAVSIAEGSSMDIVGVNTAGSATLSAAGALSDAGATSVTVTGLTDVSGTSISLGGGTFNTGTLTFNSAGAVTIAEDSSMDIVGANTAGSATLSATGALSDAGATSVAVTGLTDVSGTSISLGGGTFNTGTLTFNSAGAVTIAEDSSMDIVGANTAGSATLSATGALSDAGATSVAVTGLTDVSGTSISLGGGTFNTGTLTFNSAGAVTIAEDSSMNIVGVNTAGSATLSAAGALSDAGATSVAVTGLTDVSGTSISLGGGTFNTGTLTFHSAGAVSVAEDSATVLVGTSTANSLTLSSTGSITDGLDSNVTVANGASLSGTSIGLANDAGDVLSVGGNASFAASGAGGITIGAAGAVNFGSLSTTTTALGAATLVTEDSGLSSVTASTNEGNVNIAFGATDNVTFDATSHSLSFTAAASGVSFSNTGAIVLNGTNAAQSLAVTAGGSITDATNTGVTVTNGASFSGTSITLADNAGDVLTVGGNAAFTATTGGVTIGSAGTVNLGSLTFHSPAAVSITEDSDMQLAGSNTANSLSLTSPGFLTDAPLTSVTVTGSAGFVGGSIFLADNTGDVLNVGGNASFTSTGATPPNSIIVNGFNQGLVNFGSLTTNTPQGAFTFIRANSGLTDLTVSSRDGTTDIGFGLGFNQLLQFQGTTNELVFNAPNTNVNFANTGTTGSIVLTVTSQTPVNSAKSLNLVAATSITDAAGAQTTVTNDATFHAGTSITLADNAGDVLSVGGNASFTATAGGIAIGSAGAANFGTLTFNAPGAVSIAEGSSMDIVGVNTAGSATLSAAGALSDAGATSVAVTGLTDVSGTSISLGGGTFNTGTLTFNSAGAVSVAEGSSMDIVGVNTAGSATLSAAGALSDAGATSVTVTGLTDVSGTSISLGGGTFNTGTLTFVSAGAVSISEASDTVLSGPSFADSLSLTSAGSIKNSPAIKLSVTNNASLSGSSITLGTGLGDSVDFGTLTFNSPGAVAIREASAIVLSGTNTADSLSLTATQLASITNEPLTSLNVTQNAKLSADIITLGNNAGDSINSGSLTFNSSGAVSIREASAAVITGANTADSLTLSSMGSITDAPNTQVSVTHGASFTGTSITLADSATDRLEVGNNASFTATAAGITIGDAGFVNFGSLTFNAPGAVVVQEDCCTLIAGLNHAGSLNITSSEGITNTDFAQIIVDHDASFTGTSIVLANNATNLLNITGKASFTATTGGVTVGTANVATFGFLNFNAPGAVSVREGDGTAITGSNTASSLVLSSNGALSDAGATSIMVTGLTDVSGSSISLGSGIFNTDTLRFNSTGNVSITEASATVLSGASTAGSLALTSAGPVSQATGATLMVNGVGNINAGANSITLTNPGTDFVGTVTLKGSVTKVTDTNGISVVLDTGETVIIANGNLTSTGDLSLNGTTSGNLIGISNGGVVEWGALSKLVVGSDASPKAALLIAARPNKTITGQGSDSNALDVTTTYSKLANATGGSVEVKGGEFVLIADSLPRSPSSKDDPSITAKTAVLDIKGLTPGGRVTIVLNGQLRLLADKGVFRFTGTSVLPQGATSLDPKKVQLFIGNVSITSASDELAARSAVSAAQQSALNSASSDARQSFGTDSVTQQIDMGFAGDVGIAPTMAHNVPLQGEIISTPEGVTESKGGQ